MRADVGERSASCRTAGLTLADLVQLEEAADVDGACERAASASEGHDTPCLGTDGRKEKGK